MSFTETFSKSKNFAPISAIFAFLLLAVLAVQSHQLPQLNFKTRQSKNIVSLSDLSTATQVQTSFFTKVVQSQQNTEVVVPYSFKQNPQPLWIGFHPREGAIRQDFLISHPQINNLDWPKITEGKYTLFQRQPTYQTIKQFLDNPPDLNSTIIETGIKKEFPQLESAPALISQLDLQKANFILTTYLPSTQKDGVFYYKNVIDATSARINDLNQITWYVKAPEASQNNPFLLGQIQVNYLQ